MYDKDKFHDDFFDAFGNIDSVRMDRYNKDEPIIIGYLQIY